MGWRGMEPRVGLHDARPHAVAGLGSGSCERPARRAVGLVRDRVTWQGCGPQECDGRAFFEGEVEPCINGQVAAVGAYFGQDVRGIVDRLLGEQLPDGGWNCEAPDRSTRSSFNTTICVLEALLEYERAGNGTSAVTAARLRGQEYLLERRLFRRLSTGEVIERDRKDNGSVDALRLPDLVALRRASGARVPAQRRRHARRTDGRGYRAGLLQARRQRAVAARYPVSRRDADRDGRGRGPTEPVEHLTRPARAPLVRAR